MKLRLESTLVRRIESGVGALISIAVLVFVGIRLMHAGALWRDECALVQLARLPTIRAVLANFPHEAFPPPLPILIRFWLSIFGDHDVALRLFGFVVAAVLVGAVWVVFRSFRAGAPSLSLACVGLSSSFLIWGTSVRGYGIGTAFILLVFAAAAAALSNPIPRKWLWLAVASALSVQFLVQNTVLLVAVIFAAFAICVAQTRWRDAANIFAVAVIALASFVPYVSSYLSAAEWSVVVQPAGPPPSLLNQLGRAVGDVPVSVLLGFGICLLAVLIVGAWQLYRDRKTKAAVLPQLLIFCLLIAIAAPVVSVILFRTLHYEPQPWYWLAPLSLCATAIDMLLAGLLWTNGLRLMRPVLALVATAGLISINSFALVERQTNVDVVAKTVAERAKTADLILVNPWQLGITFERYYKGSARWITVPKVDDHQIHRYDIVKTRMMSTQPLFDVFELAAGTLQTGNRVWLVGGAAFTQGSGQSITPLPPAPNSKFGWDNVAYTKSWSRQLGAFLQKRAVNLQRVPLPDAGPVNPIENASLFVADGWK